MTPTTHNCAPALPRLAQHTPWRSPGWDADHGETTTCPACGTLWRVRVRTGVYTTRTYQRVRPWHLLSHLRAAVSSSLGQ